MIAARRRRRCRGLRRRMGVRLICPIVRASASSGIAPVRAAYNVAPRGEDIRAVIGAGRAVLLRWGIAGGHGTRPGGGGLVALDNLRQTKINQKDLSLGGNFYITRLDIAMDDRRIEGIRVSEHITDGGADHDGLFLVEQSDAIHALAQIFAFDEIHHQVLPLALDLEVIGNPVSCLHGAAKRG